MKKSCFKVFITFILVGYLFSFSSAFGKIKQTQLPSVNLLSTQNVMNLIYDEINEGELDRHENESIMDEGGAPVYGEITLEGGAQLLKTLQLTEKDVFYDLGSGLGKF
ncbi:MAG: hypothetical protein IBJ00_07330, partial [Alphaproteobacteria bacterium]|nr:hypothetical protein [Alphaproteobacteria bacterium]